MMTTLASSPSISQTSLPNFNSSSSSNKHLSYRIQCSGNTQTRNVSDPNYVRILDTTLRDGEQAPGAAMNKDQKLGVARMLARLGVDCIEAGFPASSPDNLEAVRAIALEVGNGGDNVPIVSAIARCNRRDIDLAFEALKPAKWRMITTFIATSEIHMQHKLKKTREEVVRLAREMVSYARSLGFTDIGFGAEDAGRSNREFLYVVLEEVVKAGATTIIIPDTVGYNLPSEFAQLIADIRANTPGIENAIISAHCHNDLGLATANALFAAQAGARQIDVTINGIGERAGNACLEEVVMAIKCRKEALGGLHTGIDTKYIAAASKLVAEFTGLHVQPHKPIVGANAFSHGSGIHQDGYLKCRDTYQIIFPDDIGLSTSRGSGIILGKLSGRHALKSRLLELGHNIDGKELDNVFKHFKDVADKKKYISDHDIEALISEETSQSNAIWSLGDLQVVYGTRDLSTATVKLFDSHGEEKMACAFGVGPIEAAYKAINSIVQTQVALIEHLANSTTTEIDAFNTSSVVIQDDNNRTFSGSGAGMDTVVASVRAYLCALNKMLGSRNLFVTDSSSSKVAERLLEKA